MALALVLTLDVEARQLCGPVTGSVHTVAGTRALADTLALDLPAGMDGTWALQLDLSGAGRAVAGTARLSLSNGVGYPCTARGRSAEAALAVNLAGDRGDPAARRIRMRATVTPLAGGWARLDACSGVLYGQALAW